ncbi:hypothetical protein HYH03_013290 [Edaphochlamys debaryana]|uniref:Uncharacterized protein n=1 Tax=Edaphochlamys debaryana TaxID=47281 RepID=A0A835XR64_9CHLO|nr:hypothetical protein HYH03_013290 [Edaphochlamys debaryana]|eukprot:KAG2488145.1 hypothetical protein HYH03_013290 [Edaphochlamys debaryana]
MALLSARSAAAALQRPRGRACARSLAAAPATAASLRLPRQPAAPLRAPSSSSSPSFRRSLHGSLRLPPAQAGPSDPRGRLTPWGRQEPPAPDSSSPSLTPWSKDDPAPAPAPTGGPLTPWARDDSTSGGGAATTPRGPPGSFLAAIQAARNRAAQDGAATVVRLVRQYATSHLHTRTDAYFLVVEDPAAGGQGRPGLRVWLLDGARVVGVGGGRQALSFSGIWSEEGSGSKASFPKQSTPELVAPLKLAVLEELQRQLGSEEGELVGAEWVPYEYQVDRTWLQGTFLHVRMTFKEAARREAARSAAASVLSLLTQYAAAHPYTLSAAYFLVAEDPKAADEFWGAGLRVWMLEGTVPLSGGRLQYTGARGVEGPEVVIRDAPAPLVDATKQALLNALQQQLGAEAGALGLSWRAVECVAGRHSAKLELLCASWQ